LNRTVQSILTVTCYAGWNNPSYFNII